MVQIVIPSALQAYTEKQTILSVTGDTVGECLKQLVQQYHRLQPYIYDAQGRLSCYCNTYLNNQDIRYLPERLETKITSEDKLEIIPSMAGG